MSQSQSRPAPLDVRAGPCPPPFVCSWSYRGADAASVVWVQGELDIATTPELIRTLRDAQVHAELLVLDLRELAFMDCSAAHAIVDASIHARQLGRRLVVLPVPPDLKGVWALIERFADVEIGDAALVEVPAQAEAATATYVAA
jgi:anti-anti-sigma factor